MSTQCQISRQIFPQATRGFEVSNLHRIATTVMPIRSANDNNPSATVTIRDYTLAPKQRLPEYCIKDSTYTIIPVAGTVEYCINNESSDWLDPGEALEFNGCVGEALALVNPFELELINFLIVETTYFQQPANTQCGSKSPDRKAKSLVQSFDSSVGIVTTNSRDNDKPRNSYLTRIKAGCRLQVINS